MVRERKREREREREKKKREREVRCNKKRSVEKNFYISSLQFSSEK
jgi:hypothetical protein